MKRLLKRTLRNQFLLAAPLSHFVLSSYGGMHRNLSLKTASVLMAATLGILGSSRPAHAFSLFSVGFGTYPNNQATGFNQTISVGGTANVRFTWGGNTDRITVLRPAAAGTVNGGFPDGRTLEIQFDPTDPNENVTLAIDFLNGATNVEVENFRLIVIDIDRDNSNAWQDTIQVGGTAPTPTITTANQATPALDISTEVIANFTNLPIAVDDPRAGVGAPGLSTTGNYTVVNNGGTFTGVYAPTGATTTTPNNDAVTILGTANEQDPNGGAPSVITRTNTLQPTFEAGNQTPEGTITADYRATAGQGINSIQLTYGNGPVSLSAATNPAGATGFLTNNEGSSSFVQGGAVNPVVDNGGPGNHGAGIYTVFFTPGVIGTAKSATAPTPVAGQPTQFDVTYTVIVQNFGARTTLTNVQVTDDLTRTFGGTTGFTIVPGSIIANGGQNLTVNTAFNGNGDQNLLAGNQPLAPGQSTTIQYTVRLDTTAANITPGTTYNNTAVASATTPIGLQITDQSTDGANPDSGQNSATPPNVAGGIAATGNTVDGDPRENVPTPVVLPAVNLEPQINVSEQVVQTVLAPTTGPAATYGTNTGRVTYRIRVQNTGGERLRNVTLVNDFTNTFDLDDNGFEIIAVRRVAGQVIAANANYDGGDGSDQGGVGGPNDATLLTGASLDPSQFIEYEIDVDVDLTNNGATLIRPLPGPFDNSTLATGIGDDPNTPSNRPVSDLSNDLNAVTPLPVDLSGALNPTGGSTTGGSTIGNANDPNAPAPTATPGNPAGENVPTPVNFIIRPNIGVSEQVISSVRTPAGTYGNDTVRVTYNIQVQNIGSENLNNVTLTNDFSDTFGPDASFEIISATRIAGTPNDALAANTSNANYDGGDGVDNGQGPANTNNNILLQNGVLNVGQTSTYEVVVDINTINNGANLIRPLSGPYTNSTLATGTGVLSGFLVSDRSNDFNSVTPIPPANLNGAINPNNDGTAGAVVGAAAGVQPADPGTTNSENTPTPVSIPATPEISVIERIDTTRTVVGGNTFGANNVRLVYQILVRNIGPENLQNVELLNDFRPTFGTSGNGATDDFLVIGPPVLATPPATGNLPVNATFDGSGTLLLAGGAGNPANTLPVGEFALYEITVDVNQAGANVQPRLPGPFNNQTTTSGIGVISGATTTDLSNDINPLLTNASDPNQNAEANETSENNPTPVIFGSDIRVVKRITAVTRNGQPLFTPQISRFNDQAGDANDNTLFASSNGTLPLGIVSAPTTLQSGDVVEYTVYFFNPGTAPANNLELCDVLRVPSILNTASLQLAGPNAFPTLGAFGPSALVSARTPLSPLASACENVTGTGNFPPGPLDQQIPNAGGGVVVGGPTSGLNVANNQVGAFRFSVRVP